MSEFRRLESVAYKPNHQLLSHPGAREMLLWICGWNGSRGADYRHFHASPEGLGGLVVPRVDDAAPYMLAFRRGFLNARRLSDIDGQLALGSECVSPS